MWGSDHTRTAPLHSYAEAVDYVRETGELSAFEKEAILAGTLRRVFGWDRPQPG